MASKKTLLILVCYLIILLGLSVQLEAQLQVGFYHQTCPHAEFIVKDEVQRAVSMDRGLAAGLVRMHFHDCFVRGCEASVLIDSTPSNTAEKDSPANNPSLRGFEVIDNAKKRLETMCKGVVSCADILAFAARDSIDMTGGFDYDVPSGRRDGRVSLIAETISLPPPTFNVDQLTQSFADKGLTQEEMVTLSGAHTIGRSHCTSFSNRLYSFNSTVSQDPSLDQNYAAQLKLLCPQSSTDPNLVVPMDPKSPGILDVNYYRDIQVNRGLFTSDQTLKSDPATAQVVNQYAANLLFWRTKFSAAMIKLGQVGVLTGTQGEIRLNCRVPN